MLARIVETYFHKATTSNSYALVLLSSFTGEVPTISKLNLRDVPRP